MASKTKPCILCHTRPAALPDRERMGRPVKRICRECHAARLRGDVVAIVRAEQVAGMGLEPMTAPL